MLDAGAAAAGCGGAVVAAAGSGSGGRLSAGCAPTPIREVRFRFFLTIVLFMAPPNTTPAPTAAGGGC